MRCPTVVAAIAVGAALVFARAAGAQGPAFLEPASALVMPFDVTGDRASFQIASRIGPSLGGAALQTHWVYWSADCRHLVDVFIALTDNDSVVVDPRRLQGQVQAVNPPRNHPVGPVIDLAGERGVVIVTGLAPGGSATPQLVGAWTIADPTTHAAYGADAIGIAVDGPLPDPALLSEGIFIPTFNPQALDASQIIVIGLEADGRGVRPIRRASAALGGAHVCCDVGFINDLEIGVSLPSFCFACVGFAAIAVVDPADPADVALIPPSTGATSTGVVHPQNCRSGTLDGGAELVGAGDVPQFLFAFHGQAVGPFGAALTGKYAGAGLTEKDAGAALAP